MDAILCGELVDRLLFAQDLLHHLGLETGRILLGVCTHPAILPPPSTPSPWSEFLGPLYGAGVQRGLYRCAGTGCTHLLYHPTTGIAAAHHHRGVRGAGERAAEPDAGWNADDGDGGDERG